MIFTHWFKVKWLQCTRFVCREDRNGSLSNNRPSVRISSSNIRSGGGFIKSAIFRQIDIDSKFG